MSQIGRISGPVLRSNLERNGIDLAFRNNSQTAELLFFDVNRQRVAVNQDAASREVDVNGTTFLNNLETLSLSAVDYEIYDDVIEKSLGSIYLDSGQVINFNKLSNDNIFVENNVISTQDSNSSLDLKPFQGKTVKFLSNTRVLGNMSTAKNITLNGELKFGDSANDTVDFNSFIASDLTPDNTNVSRLGSLAKSWRNVFSDRVSSTQFLISDIGISNNTVSSQNADNDLELAANGTGSVISASNVTVTNNFDVLGTSVFSNLSTRGFDLTADLELFNNLSTDNLSIEGTLAVDGTTTRIDNVEINGNSITTAVSNLDLELRANSAGFVTLQEDVLVGKSLTANTVNTQSTMTAQQLVFAATLNLPTFLLSGNKIANTIADTDVVLSASTNNTLLFLADADFNQNLTAGNSDVKNIGINGDLSLSGNRTTVGNYGLTGLWTISDKLQVESSVLFDQVRINDNTLQSMQDNLVLAASSAGFVSFPLNNVEISKNLSVGAANFSNIDLKVLSAKTLNTGDVEISDNYIETVIAGQNLDLEANSTGSVSANDLFFKNSKLSTENSSIVFASPFEINIESTGSLRLPRGVTPTAATTDAVANTRFNLEDSVFEGFQNAVATFGGVYSDDRKTTVLADFTDNTVTFTVNLETVGTVNDQGIELIALRADELLLDKNSITTDGVDLQLTATGDIRTSTLSIQNSQIKNLAVDKDLSFSGTKDGYQKIKSSSGVVIPRGTTLERPETPEVGESRWNTETDIFEVWDGSVFIDATGSAEFLTEQEFNELITEYTLMFG